MAPDRWPGVLQPEQIAVRSKQIRNILMTYIES
jgi:hypothetical protein